MCDDGDRNLDRRGIRTWVCVLRYKTNLVGVSENGREELKHIFGDSRERDKKK